VPQVWMEKSRLLADFQPCRVLQTSSGRSEATPLLYLLLLTLSPLSLLPFLARELPTGRMEFSSSFTPTLLLSIWTTDTVQLMLIAWVKVLFFCSLLFPTHLEKKKKSQGPFSPKSNG
jgi:hypothetical protein